MMEILLQCTAALVVVLLFLMVLYFTLVVAAWLFVLVDFLRVAAGMESWLEVIVNRRAGGKALSR